MFRMLDEFREDVSLMCDAIRNGHTSKMQQRFIDEFFQEEFDADSPLDSTQRRNRVPSALSSLNFRVNRLEFAACVVDLHLPVHTALTPVDINRPSTQFRL